MKIIPAIDIIDGRCVRLTQGDYKQIKTYSDDPLSIAKQFEDAGLKFLHLVDLDGAKNNRIINQKVLYDIASQTNLEVDFGGGIKSENDLKTALESGAKKVTVGSLAAKNPEIFVDFLERYGSDTIILGADCRFGKIATNGWIDQSDTEVSDFISSFSNAGLRQVICTEISKDGMLEGPAVALYQKIIGKHDIELIASGGISSMEDIDAVKAVGCSGVIIGKAIYEGKISLKQLRDYA